jgi:hypothetical protein
LNPETRPPATKFAAARTDLHNQISYPRFPLQGKILANIHKGDEHYYKVGWSLRMLQTIEAGAFTKAASKIDRTSSPRSEFYNVEGLINSIDFGGALHNYIKPLLVGLPHNLRGS